MTNLLSTKLTESINNQCFYGFPSGKGSWVQNVDSNILEDGNLISAEELIELICSKESPWKANNDLSNEIISIKKDLIRKKGVYSGNFVQQNLHSLRLLNKDIVHIDKGLKTMQNVKELILSANHINYIDAENLPQKLEVLELYSNNINLVEFCCHKHMPPLKHLGLGSNKIINSVNFSSSILKNSLVSLDLGRNFLTELSSTIFAICQLKSIKNLILAGNPLSLLAIYRGFVVDSIKSLNCLDDITISADERYSVQKMHALPDTIKKKCKLNISIPSINNIPVKEISENAPEEPVIKTQYYVQFWFPIKCLTKEEKDLENKLTETDVYIDIMYLHKCESVPRLDPEILLNWSEDIDISNVRKFCEFLDTPLSISVMEETKYLYSPENLPAKGLSRMNSQNSKKHTRDKSANKNVSNEKSKKDTGKKKKIDETKLVIHSTSIKTLAQYFVNLSSFKDGTTTIHELLKTDILHTPEEIENQKKSKKIIETKVKKLSAKERTKSAEKTTVKKGEKLSTFSDSETEPVKPIECHITLDLLVIKNAKTFENL